MKQTKHTPGPWEIRSAKRKTLWRIYGIRSAVMRRHVAELRSYPGRPPETVEADARLMAAAPEMYSALKEADEIISRLSSGYQSIAVRSALQKAEGNRKV